MPAPTETAWKRSLVVVMKAEMYPPWLQPMDAHPARVNPAFFYQGIHPRDLGWSTRAPLAAQSWVG